MLIGLEWNILDVSIKDAPHRKKKLFPGMKEATVNSFEITSPSNKFTDLNSELLECQQHNNIVNNHFREKKLRDNVNWDKFKRIVLIFGGGGGWSRGRMLVSVASKNATTF